MFRVKRPKTSKYKYCHFDKVGPFSLYNSNLSSFCSKQSKFITLLLYYFITLLLYYKYERYQI
jgi:hypothetical protein